LKFLLRGGARLPAYLIRFQPALEDLRHDK
jgi:hypothetical protein